MTSKEYVEKVLRSESVGALGGIDTMRAMRLMHATLGIATEAGEFVDLMKRQLFYGKHPTTAQIVEELGDLMWYAAIAIDEIGASFEEVWAKNIAKLRVRYPDKFMEDKAINRDLPQEQKALEGK